MNGELTDADFNSLRKLVYEFTGISLSEQKRQLLKSRLQRRLRALGIGTYAEYQELVAHQGPNGPEAPEFINAITTNKTDFYREKHHFDFIVDSAVPALLAANQNQLKIWHAGCSTGEEAYTLGIELTELTLKHRNLSFRQLATDIDTNVLDHAERGVYTEDRTDTIPPDRLRRYFLQGKGEQAGFHKVVPELRENIVFRQLNLIGPTWPLNAATKFHFIFCRNVIIYFDRQTQNRLLDRFHERLLPGGFLILGHSESIHGHQDTYRNVGKTIFQAIKPADEKAA